MTVATPGRDAVNQAFMGLQGPIKALMMDMDDEGVLMVVSTISKLSLDLSMWLQERTRQRLAQGPTLMVPNTPAFVQGVQDSDR